MSREFETLSLANKERQRIWDPDGKITLVYRSNELAGETGEACNIMKKIERERLGIKGSRATKEQAAEELADVIICASLLANELDIALWPAVVAKFNKTSRDVGFPVFLRAEPSEVIGTAAAIAQDLRDGTFRGVPPDWKPEHD